MSQSTTQRLRERPRVAIVVPCFNEEEVIAITHQRLLAVLATLDCEALELIYVDDCSQDETLAILKTIQLGDERVRIISFSRNFGQPMAVTAGLAHASGDAVIVMDADLQDPPEVIPEMLACWGRGADVVYGVRQTREGESLFKKWTAKGYAAVFNALSEHSASADTGYFRLMDRRVVDILLTMPERDRFLHGMVNWVGFNHVPVTFHRAARAAGVTKYPVAKMLQFAFDGIFAFSRAPLRTALWTGVFFLCLAAGLLVYQLVSRLYAGHWLANWMFVMTGGFFFSGLHLVFLGIVGEYLGKVYDEVRRRPLYLIRERLGFPPGTDAPSHLSEWIRP